MFCIWQSQPNLTAILHIFEEVANLRIRRTSLIRFSTISLNPIDG